MRAGKRKGGSSLTELPPDYVFRKKILFAAFGLESLGEAGTKLIGLFEALMARAPVHAHRFAGQFDLHVGQELLKHLGGFAGPAVGAESAAHKDFGAETLDVGQSAHDVGQDRVVVSRRTNNEAAGVRKGGHDGAVVIGLAGHDSSGNPVVLEAGADGIGHLFGGVPHGVVDDDSALAGFLFGHGLVEIDDFFDAFIAGDQTVVRSDHVDVQGSDNGQRFQHLGRIGQDDVEVIFLRTADEITVFVLVDETFGAGDILAESVLGEKNFGFRAVGHHAIRPVQHAGFLEDQCVLANGDLISAFYRLHGPVFHLIAVVAGHGLEGHGGAENFFRLAGADDFTERAFMVEFHVVDDQVVDLFGLNDVAEAAEKRAGLPRSYGINKGVFFILDKIGVVRSAFRALGIAVKVVMIVVDASDPVDIFKNFDSVHKPSAVLYAQINAKTAGVLRPAVYNHERLVLNLGEFVLAGAADGADPVIRQLVERNVVVFGGIINVTADAAFVFIHN